MKSIKVITTIAVFSVACLAEAHTEKMRDVCVVGAGPGGALYRNSFA